MRSVLTQRPRPERFPVYWLQTEIGEQWWTLRRKPALEAGRGWCPRQAPPTPSSSPSPEPRVLLPPCPQDAPGENGLLGFICLYITYFL